MFAFLTVKGQVAFCESKAKSTGAGGRQRNWPKRRVAVGIVFETGRMAPILFHGLRNQLGLPVVCVESRQALPGAQVAFATHKTDRNDARGLAHLARTGFFKPVHVKSLRAHALRSPDQRAQEAGQASE